MITDIAEDLLAEAGLAGLHNTHVCLWPGKVDHRLKLPLAAALRWAYPEDGGATPHALRLDPARAGLAMPPSAPIARLAKTGLFLQRLALAPDLSRVAAALEDLRRHGPGPIWEAVPAAPQDGTSAVGGDLSPAFAVMPPADAALPNEGRLGPGLVVVTGATASGKTSLLRELVQHEVASARFSLVQWGEPVREAAGSFTMAHLEEAIADALSVGKTVVAVDSVKNLLLGTENLGAGGLSQAFQAHLSTWSAAAASAGITLVLILNVLTMEREQRRVVERALAGHVTSLVSLQRVTGHAPSAVVTSRLWPGRAETSVARISFDLF